MGRCSVPFWAVPSLRPRARPVHGVRRRRGCSWLEDGRFKTLAGLVVDPVCRMQVEPTGPHVDWEGWTLWFCSEGCRTEFTADPQRFIVG